jgi:integrase
MLLKSQHNTPKPLMRLTKFCDGVPFQSVRTRIGSATRVLPVNLPAIDAATPGQVIHDDAVPGLRLRAFPTRKSFYLWYRTKAGVQRQPKIGDHPTITLTAARRIAKEILEQVAMGKDPMADRNAARAAPTVAEVCEKYMERYGPKKKSTRTDRRVIDRYVLPAFGRRRVTEIRMVDVENLHGSMSATPYMANRVLSLLAVIFKKAEKWEYRTKGSNPCDLVERFPEHKRRRYMSRDEASAIVRALRDHGPRYPEQAAFLWLLIYTGARPSEIAALKPEHRNGDIVTLEDHKTAGVTGQARIIHLPAQAVEILDRLPTKRGTLLGIAKPRHLWEKIVEETGITGLRMYDLRHSFASIGLSNGLSLSTIGELLGHRSSETTKRYAHLIDEFGRAAVATTADAFDAYSKPNLKVVK